MMQRFGFDKHGRNNWVVTLYGTRIFALQKLVMFMHSELCIDHYLTRDIMQGLRSKLSHNIPESFKNLIILIKSQETLLQKIEYSKPKDIDLSDIINLEPPEMINFIKKKNLVKFINKNELTAMKKIDNGHFGSISTAIWKKADKLVVCKK
ncbi:unnamed protein product [Rhizophagus irregularis]|uniref:Uncharacterized protein n=1 Tax=Rhizophagus irregularis TaxID=588596 RepID=A0A2N1NAW8_9GLOM|nr:hypothetical protein RhiirC2_779010 [Rhizophagus irregularis]CAB5347341.1 unnamed protein product [Rhizophagus irregularis]